MAAVFMRTEPPVDETFTTATLILDLVDPVRTAMINDPRGLRACSEHLLPLRFPELIPPTIVTADARTIRAFLVEHRVAVLKPVDGFSGRGVLRLDRHDPNLASLIELSTGNGTRPVVVQRFLREVAEGNKRVFVVAGSPVGAVYRFPTAGDFRIGNPTAEAPLTARDRDICARLAPTLRRHGIHAGGARCDRAVPDRGQRDQRRRSAQGRRPARLDAVRGPGRPSSQPTHPKEIGMTTAIICSALLAALLFLLGANVTRLRVVTGKAGGSQLPDDPANRLLIAVRAHGNATEYIPVLVVLFLLVGARSPAWVAIPLIVGGDGGTSSCTRTAC